MRAAALLLAPSFAAFAAFAAPPAGDAGTISGLGARNIGSAQMSGRIAALAGRVADDGKVTLFVGAASGGVWKSVDGGTTFKPVFDKQPVQSIGAIALDPSDPRVVWVGTGESWTRNSVSIGDGVYRSGDGGETWKNMGLPGSERVNRILVHPKKSDVVYACVPGRLWSDSADRGLYKTTDGGKSWSLVLKGGNLSTGCSGLAMDPTQPGPPLRGPLGLPPEGLDVPLRGRRADGRVRLGPLPHGGRRRDVEDARCEVRAGPARGAVGPPRRRDRSVEARPRLRRDRGREVGALPLRGRRQDVGPEGRQPADGLAAVLLLAPHRRPDEPRPRLQAEPDAHRLRGRRQELRRRGRRHARGPPRRLDQPEEPEARRDGRRRRAVDLPRRREPLVEVQQPADLAVLPRVRGRKGRRTRCTAACRTTARGPATPRIRAASRTAGGRTSTAATASGCSWTRPTRTSSTPRRRAASSAGSTGGRSRRATSSRRLVYKEKLRWNWNTPIHLSRLEKGKLYLGAQFLFVTKDGGQSWQRISPDLTTNDPEKQKQEQSGGITVDNSAAEMHTTIYSISESPRDAKTIWVGTDDGNVQLTRDGGAAWTNLVKNVPGLPPASWVSWVEAGPHADGTAYAAFDRHTFGDMEPWVYATQDFGKTWERIAGPSSGVRGWAYVIREDPVRRRPPLSRHRVRPLDLRGRRKDVAGVQGRELPVRLRARPRVPDARPRPRRRDARARDLDRRRPDAAPRAHRGRPREGRRVPSGAPGRPEAARPGRLARRRRLFRRSEPAGRRGHFLLQKTRHTFGRMKPRGPRRVGPRRRHARRGQEEGDQPGRLVDAGEAPARPDGRAGGRRRRGAARPPRHVHRAPHEGKGRRRDSARRRARPEGAVHARRPQGPVRRRDARPRALRAHERRRGPLEPLPGGRGRAREGPSRGRRAPQGSRRVRGEGRRHPQGRRRHVRGRSDHGRGAPARAPRVRLRRDPLVRGAAGRLPGRARRRPRARAHGRRGARLRSSRRRTFLRST